MTDWSAEPPVRRTSSIRPNTPMAKNSAGPNLRATFARKGDASMSPTMLMVPAMNEPTAETVRAAPARPFWAMRYPSRQVTTEAASPGMFSRMDVVDPPYMAP